MIPEPFATLRSSRPLTVRSRSKVASLARAGSAVRAANAATTEKAVEKCFIAVFISTPESFTRRATIRFHENTRFRTALKLAAYLPMLFSLRDARAFAHQTGRRGHAGPDQRLLCCGRVRAGFHSRDAGGANAGVAR